MSAEEGSETPAAGGASHRPIRIGAPGPLHERQPSKRRRRGRTLDRVIGILLGIVLGIGIVTAFVFLGSEDTIDAPRIANGDGATGEQGTEGPGVGAEAPVVEATGGMPPASGPAKLTARVGEQILFKVSTDAPLAIAIPGLGVEQTVADGDVVTFPAEQPGQFPIVAADSQIAIATLEISR